jgi:hemerythrin-like domain-containing protein
MEPTYATQLMRNNHKVLRGLFRQFEVVDRRAHEMKQGVVNEILMMLEVHFELEEEFLYPALKNSAKEHDRELADHALAQHEEIRQLMTAIRRRSIQEENFNIGALNLISTAEEHLKFEQEETYKAAEVALGSLLDEMGPRMQARQEELIASPRYKNARPSVVQNPHGGEQKRKRAA